MRDEKLQQAVQTVIDPATGALRGEKITITVYGKQSMGRRREPQRNREISVTLQGDAARQFITNPTYEAIYEAFHVDPQLFLGGNQEIRVEEVEIIAHPQ